MSDERDLRDGPASVSKPPVVNAGSEVLGENVAIFSLPAVELVNQWWRESNRRWAESRLSIGLSSETHSASGR